MTLEIHEYVRKPFTVNAVEITLQNVHQVAEWCNGTVEMVSTRILGSGKTDLPVIRIRGNGDFRDKTFTGSLGSFIAEMNGSFRVYTPQNMAGMFDRVETSVQEQTPHAPEVENLSEEQLRSML